MTSFVPPKTLPMLYAENESEARARKLHDQARKDAAPRERQPQRGVVDRVADAGAAPGGGDDKGRRHRTPTKDSSSHHATTRDACAARPARGAERRADQRDVESFYTAWRSQLR